MIAHRLAGDALGGGAVFEGQRFFDFGLSC